MKNVNQMLFAPDQKGQAMRSLDESHLKYLTIDQTRRMFPPRREKKRLLSYQMKCRARKKSVGVPHRCYQGKKDARQLFQNSFRLNL